MSDRANRIVLRRGVASLCSTIVSVAGSALVAAIVTVPWGPNSFVFIAAFVALAVPLVHRGWKVVVADAEEKLPYVLRPGGRGSIGPAHADFGRCPPTLPSTSMAGHGLQSALMLSVLHSKPKGSPSRRPATVSVRLAT
jgi:hypothetical protein